MEPWESRRCYEGKGIPEKAIEAAVIMYAGFAICIMAAIAEGVTIPLARRAKNRMKRWRRES